MERKDWLLWRHNKITASDAAAIHNKSPYKTVAELWAEKSLKDPPDTPTSFVMSKGNDLEPILRKRFCAWWGIENGDDPFEPALCEMKSHPYIGASLDGLSRDKKTLVEIKYVGKKVLATAQVPIHYYIQIQHQFLASGAEYGYCVMANDPTGMDMCILPVERNQSFIDTHLIACTAFWHSLKINAAPEPDIAIIKDEKAIELAEDYEQLKKTADQIAEAMEETKSQLLLYAVKDQNKIANLYIAKILTKGIVDYSKIEALKSVNLDDYRKEPKVSYRITVDK
jgi:putative phage-type endonuclease